MTREWNRRTSGTLEISIGNELSFGVTHCSKVHQQSGSVFEYVKVVLAKPPTGCTIFIGKTGGIRLSNEVERTLTLMLVGTLGMISFHFALAAVSFARMVAGCQMVGKELIRLPDGA